MREYFRVANDKCGHQKLKRKLAKHDIHCIVMEATGKLHRRVHRTLHASDLPVAVINPYRSRKFADNIGQLARTDKIDTRVLSMQAQQLQLEASPPVPEALGELQELVNAWHSAKAEKTALGNRLGSPQTGFLKAELKHTLKSLKGHIARLEKDIIRRIAYNETLARRYKILLSVPGIGKAAAITLICSLNELGSSTDKQIASLAGVAADELGFRQDGGASGVSGVDARVCATCFT